MPKQLGYWKTSSRKLPDYLKAYYCRGILYLDNGDPEKALEMFSKVSDKDPTDGYATYYTGQCLAELSRLEEALEKFQLAIERDPYLRAYYGAFQAMLRLGRMDEATEYREAFQKLEGNPQARLAEIKYTRMGPKAEVHSLVATAEQPVDIKPPFFGSPTRVSQIRGRNVTVCDINQDGQLDLFLVGADGKNSVLLNNGTEYIEANDHPLSQVSNVNTVLWGDIDNDGLVDAYLLCQGPNHLFRQTAANQWQDVTQTSGIAGADVNSVDGAIFDADHDGDLDIFVVNQGDNQLFNNNLDGTFRSLAAEYGLTGDGQPSRSVVVADLDRDRDADILVINDKPPHQAYFNDRLWSYRPAEGWDKVLTSSIECAVAVDGDADGQLELVGVANGSLVRWKPDDNGQWITSDASEDTDLTAPILAADVSGDGQIEFLVGSARGPIVLNQQLNAIDKIAIPANYFTLLVTGKEKGPSLLVQTDAAADEDADSLVQLPPSANRARFITMTFSGKEDRGEQMRSNRSGIGVDGAVRMGARWSAFHTYRNSSGPGQSLQPWAVGLGSAGQLDYVRLTWPDGVFQTELNVPIGGTQSIVETQRQVASCPVVFCWNGEEFEFVTDVLGVGGIGFNVADGQYGEPRPWENLLLSEERWKSRDGKLELRIGEPMEEAMYLDAVRLTSLDVPDSYGVVLDERFAIASAAPTGEAWFYENELQPVAAVNHAGQDVLEQITEADLVAVEPAEVDRRFLGRTDFHSVTLTFEQPLDQLQRPVLVFDGWIEYPYSQTMFAAWQANASFDAPTLEAASETGEWQTVVAHFGYMAGMPRRSALPLDIAALPKNTVRLRLSCNVELYWDRIAVVDVQPAPDGVVRTSLPLRSAVVAENGFAKRTTLPQRRPFYDYSQRSPLWDTRHLTGLYTAFGQSLPLVEQADSALAIIGPGEEIQLQFDAAAPPPTGSKRYYLLEFAGWCKDKDLYTKDGDTLAPLPRQTSTSSDPIRTESLHRQFNTRYRSGF
ncbi:MAG: FG-GAP-like repeat-containing protein [Pirellulaceae bacterium]